MEIGLKHRLETKVTSQLLASTVGSGEVDVFATPMMIAFMEKTAAESVKPFIGEGNVTVGTSITTSHVAATPLGMTVSFESELTGINGKQLTFSLKAFDEKELIGEGVHSRVIVNHERFIGKAQSKL